MRNLKVEFFAVMAAVALTLGVGACTSPAQSGGPESEPVSVSREAAPEPEPVSEPEPEPTPVSVAAPEPEPSAQELADAVMRGEYGDGDTRRALLGDRFDEVQEIVNGMMPQPEPEPEAEPQTVSEPETMQVPQPVQQVQVSQSWTAEQQADNQEYQQWKHSMSYLPDCGVGGGASCKWFADEHNEADPNSVDNGSLWSYATDSDGYWIGAYWRADINDSFGASF